MRHSRHVFNLLRTAGFTETKYQDDQHRAYTEPVSGFNFVLYNAPKHTFTINDLYAMPPSSTDTIPGQAPSNLAVGIQYTHQLWTAHAANLQAAGVAPKHLARTMWLYTRIYHTFGRRHGDLPYSFADCAHLAATGADDATLRAYTIRCMPTTTILDAIQAGGIQASLTRDLYTPQVPTPPLAVDPWAASW